MFEEPETWVAIAFVILMGVFGYFGVHRTVLKALDNRSARIKAELDDLLDEIDEVLEDNAEEFVRNYVQKGGQ